MLAFYISAEGFSRKIALGVTTLIAATDFSLVAFQQHSAYWIHDT